MGGTRTPDSRKVKNRSSKAEVVRTREQDHEGEEDGHEQGRDKGIGRNRSQHLTLKASLVSYIFTPAHLLTNVGKYSSNKVTSKNP